MTECVSRNKLRSNCTHIIIYNIIYIMYKYKNGCCLVGISEMTRLKNYRIDFYGAFFKKVRVIIRRN